MEEPKRENKLGLSNDDLENTKQVLDDLIDIVVTFNGVDEPTPADWTEFKAVLDFANFVISGVIYANGIELCDHEHDDEDDEDGVE